MALPHKGERMKIESIRIEEHDDGTFGGSVSIKDEPQKKGEISGYTPSKTFTAKKVDKIIKKSSSVGNFLSGKDQEATAA